MNDPWQFLILDRNTASEKDVKAAYARLLKQHRPDQDPDGFRKLRDAYEAALVSIKHRDASAEPPPAYATPDSASDAGDASLALDGVVIPFDSASLPEAVRASFAEIEHAMSTGNDEQMQAAAAEFCAACGKANVPAAEQVSALQHAFRRDAKLAARGLTGAVLVSLAEGGQTSFCHMVVSVWQAQNEQKRLADFGFAMLDHRRLLTTPDDAILMAQVALIAGLEFPKMATMLADAAFPHLPLDGRTEFVARIENQIALGRIFDGITPEAKPFWFRVLRGESAVLDWSSPEAQRALDDAVANYRFQWEGWGIVSQLLPPECWAPVEKKLQAQAKFATQQTQSPAWLRNLAWVFVPLVMAVAFLGSLTNSNSPPPTRSIPSYPYSRESRGHFERARQVEPNRRIQLDLQNLKPPAPGILYQKLSAPSPSPFTIPTDIPRPAQGTPQIALPQTPPAPSVNDMIYNALKSNGVLRQDALTPNQPLFPVQQPSR